MIRGDSRFEVRGALRIEVGRQVGDLALVEIADQLLALGLEILGDLGDHHRLDVGVGDSLARRGACAFADRACRHGGRPRRRRLLVHRQKLAADLLGELLQENIVEIAVEPLGHGQRNVVGRVALPEVDLVVVVERIGIAVSRIER